MSITDYASLVASARQQEQPQRLLFTFTRAEAEPGGQGKSLTPVLCADKLPEELNSFDALLEESKQMPTHWDVVFVAGLAGSGGQPPASQAMRSAAAGDGQGDRGRTHRQPAGVRPQRRVVTL